MLSAAKNPFFLPSPLVTASSSASPRLRGPRLDPRSSLLRPLGDLGGSLATWRFNRPSSHSLDRSTAPAPQPPPPTAPPPRSPHTPPRSPASPDPHPARTATPVP